MRRLPAMLTTVTAALLILGGVAACGGSDSAGEETAERIAEKLTGGKVDVDRKGDKITFKGGDGESTVEVGGGKPKDWPSEVPLPDGKITSSVSGTSDSGKNWTVTLDVDGDPFKVIDEYRSRLEADGFEITNSVDLNSGTGRSKSFTAKKSTLMVNAMIGSDSDNERALFISVQERSDRN